MRNEARVVLFEKREKYEVPYSGRAPKTLVARLEKIADLEGESVNQTRAKLISMGADVFDWMMENGEAIHALQKEDRLLPHEIVSLALSAGLAAFLRERKGKR